MTKRPTTSRAITATPAPQVGAGDRLQLMATFVRIVEAGSLSGAAAQLNTTQPTVSRRLQALERTLGLRLLQRSTRAMRLTEDGERCFERAKALLEKKGVAFEEIKVDGKPQVRAEMAQKAGRTSVPQIWIGDKHIGGCDDLYALERAGKLDALLKA